MDSFNFTDEIKERIDIVEFISEYVPLKKAGSNFKGLCPFHKEKTPSFMVNPAKKIFHCFGCHKGGDVFNFLMYYENITFQEAVNRLSLITGIKIGSQRGLSKDRETLLKIYDLTATLFYENLINHNKPISYLKKRGIKQDVIDIYKIGYSINDVSFLFRYLKEKGFKDDDIFKSRLVHKDGDRIWDFFRDRIMFPIYDKDGHVIAFGGRTLSDSKSIPKYINSPDTEIFKKGSSLFGLHQSKNSIIHKGYAILVEGYIDVIMCFQHGIENVVAPLGTALTEQQLERIKKYTNNILLMFDGDTAGISATKRAIELVMQKSLNAKIVLLPKNEDPDSMLTKQGHEALRQLISRSVTPVGFYFRLFEGKNKIDCIRALLNVIMLNGDVLQREDYIKQISEYSGLNELAIRHEADNVLKRLTKRIVKEDKISTDSNTNHKTAEEYVVQMVLEASAELRQEVCNMIKIDGIQDCASLRIINKIKKYNDLDGHDLYNALLLESDDEERAFLTRLGFKQGYSQDVTHMSLNECVKNMLIKIVEKQMKEETQKGNLALANKLLAQKRILSKLNVDND
ncbi:MAG: DNA primase [Thermodesulfovibrionales bacterium]|nr:DNA primase [Thermodesulfovibrionales bacterium]